MDFVEFRDALITHVNEMTTSDVKNLFVVNLDKDVLWNKYLDSFPAGKNEIFRKRREFDCSCCRSFIRAFGNVVSIKNNRMITVWDFFTGDDTYQPVLNELSKYVLSFPVADLFVTKVGSFGVKENHEMSEDKVLTWPHFYVNLPKRFVTTKKDKSEASIAGEYRDLRNVFKRSLDEIKYDAILTVIELISQNSLYKGEEWSPALNQFCRLHDTYHNVLHGDIERSHWTWVIAGEVGGAVGKIKNHSIGTLLMDISEGVDLDEAVRKYEQMVAPSNYKRPKAIFTKRMLEDAQKKVEELGLMDSLNRRFAVLDDITAPNILFANRNIARLQKNNVFDALSKDNGVNVKSFSRVDEVSINDFVRDILPNASKIEVLLENRHIPNMVSLIAPVNCSPTLFKWDNNFSWAYSGNITDSMKERVKAAGGNVDGVLRFSLQWNEDLDNQNDLDAHVYEPNGNHIYYPVKRMIHKSSGSLDVDIIDPGNKVAVENIIYIDPNRMPEGLYDFKVHCFSYRGGTSGFSAELEFDGQIHSFEYRRDMRTGMFIDVVKVHYSRKDGFKILSSLSGNTSVSTKDVWNLKTNQFYPVSIAMYSPNYWDEQDGIGHRHYFFMIDGCKNNEKPNGFFNEFLREEFMPHKRVFEALGSKMKVDDSDSQLSGIGFSSTKKNSVICKVEGNFNRTIKITF